MLSPGDALLHALGKAAGSPGRRSLIWVADSWLIMNRMNVGWEEVIDGADLAGLALPILPMLRFLRTSLGAPVPDPVLERLEKACGRMSPLHRDVALYHAREGASIAATFAAVRPRGWRALLYWVRLLLVPSADYLRWTGAVRHPALLPVRYVTRPFSWLWQAVAARVRVPRPLPP